jgi:hypothetical protein
MPLHTSSNFAIPKECQRGWFSSESSYKIAITSELLGLKAQARNKTITLPSDML